MNSCGSLAQKELPVGLQRVDGVHAIVYVGVQGLDLLLGGRGQQKIVHLGLHHIINLEINKEFNTAFYQF